MEKKHIKTKHLFILCIRVYQKAKHFTFYMPNCCSISCTWCQNLGHQTQALHFQTFWSILRDLVNIFQSQFIHWNSELKHVEYHLP